MTRTGSYFATAAFGCLSIAIVWNAMLGQNGRHPAPIAITKIHQVDSVTRKALQDDYTARMTLAQFPRSISILPKSRQQVVVQDLQSELTEMDFYDGVVDGLPGPRTRDAIMAYQKANGLAVNGEPTEELLDKLRFNRRIAEVAQTPAPTTTSAIAPPKESVNKDVQLVQSGLAELGYSPGPVDGVLGEQTRQAIRKFEQDRQLVETGRISPLLLRELRKVTGVSVLSST